MYGVYFVHDSFDAQRIVPWRDVTHPVDDAAMYYAVFGDGTVGQFLTPVPGTDCLVRFGSVDSCLLTGGYVCLLYYRSRLPSFLPSFHFKGSVLCLRALVANTREQPANR